MNNRVAIVCIAVLGLTACFSLTPMQARRVVELTPIDRDDGAYQIDLIDTSAVYVREGLRVRVRHLSDAHLDADIPGLGNPYTYQGTVHPSLGHVPIRFTVFQLTVTNPTFDKVMLPPERAILVTDRGHIMHPYELSRAEARGSVRNFETYWLSRGVQSGNAQKLYLERMGVLRGTVYHRNAFVFRGNSYTGKLVFDPLPAHTHSVRLRLEDFVLEFGLYDVPEQVADLEFRFSVLDKVLEPKSDDQRTVGMPRTAQ